MILIITETFDPHADFVEPELDNRNLTWRRLHLSDFPQLVSASYGFGPGRPDDCITIRKEPIRMREIDVVWYRRTESFSFPTEMNDQDRRIARRECQEFVQGLWSAMSHAFWVSEPHAIRQASNKAEQLCRAKRFGFRIPITCFSNDPVAVQAFYETYSRETGVIYKPHTFILVHDETDNVGIVYTTKIGPDEMARIDEIVLAPGIFQVIIPKKLDIRVTVFGHRWFACEIHSVDNEATRIDWRSYTWDGNEDFPRHRSHELPDMLGKNCVDLTRSYGLAYAAIDFILTPEGDYVFLEINPNGQWAWIQNETNQPLREALVDIFIQKPKI